MGQYLVNGDTIPDILWRNSVTGAPLSRLPPAIAALVTAAKALPLKPSSPQPSQESRRRRSMAASPLPCPSDWY